MTLMEKPNTLHAPGLFHYIDYDQSKRLRAEIVFQAVSESWLKPQISQIFTLDDFKQAHLQLEDRNNTVFF